MKLSVSRLFNTNGALTSMNTEHCLNDSDRGIQKYLRMNPLKCELADHKLQMDCLGMNLGPPQ
jgi:hypothetical protein